MLTPKQQRFVEEYCVDLNATQAAIRAGYSAKTANQKGAGLLDHPEIRAAIDAAKSRRSEATGITSERVLREIAAMAFYDPAALVGVSRALGNSDSPGEGEAVVSVGGRRYAVTAIRSPEDIASLPDDIRRAIVGWSWDRNQNFTLKLADKGRALDQLMRHLSLYNDRIEVDQLSGLAEHLAHARGLRDEWEEQTRERMRDQFRAQTDREGRTPTITLPAVISPPPPRPAPEPVQRDRVREPQFHSTASLRGSEDWHPPQPEPPPSAGYRPILPLKAPR